MAELNKRNIHNVANAFHFSTVEKILGLVMASDLRNTFRPLGALAEDSNGGGSSSGGTTVISNEDTIQGLE